jgi:hypothetical protein
VTDSSVAEELTGMMLAGVIDAAESIKCINKVINK